MEKISQLRVELGQVIASLENYLRCRKEQIAFSVDGGIGRDIGTSDVDLVCLLSNLLDNAIEACLQVEPEKRRINVKFTQRAGCLFIREENSKRSGSVIKDGVVQEQEITTGEKLGDLLVVTGGVKAGDRVVLNPPKGLKAGSRVKQAEK